MLEQGFLSSVQEDWVPPTERISEAWGRLGCSSKKKGLRNLWKVGVPLTERVSEKLGEDWGTPHRKRALEKLAQE